MTKKQIIERKIYVRRNIEQIYVKNNKKISIARKGMREQPFPFHTSNVYFN